MGKMLSVLLRILAGIGGALLKIYKSFKGKTEMSILKEVSK